MKLLDSWLPISSTASISQRYEGLQQYEQIVHKDVFLPAWNSMKVLSIILNNGICIFLFSQLKVLSNLEAHSVVI